MKNPESTPSSFSDPFYFKEGINTAQVQLDYLDEQLTILSLLRKEDYDPIRTINIASSLATLSLFDDQAESNPS